MAKRYTRKAQLQPDEFVSFWQRSYEVLSPYGRAIGFATFGALAVLAISWGLDHFFTGRRQEATAAMGRAVRLALADLISEKSDPAHNDPPAEEVPRYKTEKERSEAVIAEVDKLRREHKASAAARESLLTKARALHDLRRYSEAIVAYQEFLKAAEPNDPLARVAREGLGLAFEAEGNLKEAVEAFRALESHGGEAFRDRAKFAQARLLVKQKEPKAARAIYQEILAKSPESPLRDSIQVHLAALNETQGG